MFIKLWHVPNRRFFNDLCDILGIANSVIYYLSTPSFAPLCARQIHRIALHPLVDIDAVAKHHGIHTTELLNV